MKNQGLMQSARLFFYVWNFPDHPSATFKSNLQNDRESLNPSVFSNSLLKQTQKTTVMLIYGIDLALPTPHTMIPMPDF